MLGAAQERGCGAQDSKFFFQETFEKASLSSSSSGAASLKSELSESAELPGEGFHMPCGKEEDRPCEEALSEDNFQLESVEKGESAVREVRAGTHWGPSVSRLTFFFFSMCRCVF